MAGIFAKKGWNTWFQHGIRARLVRRRGARIITMPVYSRRKSEHLFDTTWMVYYPLTFRRHLCCNLLRLWAVARPSLVSESLPLSALMGLQPPVNLVPFTPPSRIEHRRVPYVFHPSLSA